MEVPLDGHTKMVVMPSGGTFTDPVGSGSHMELWSSTVKFPLAHYLTPHLTTVGAWHVCREIPRGQP